MKHISLIILAVLVLALLSFAHSRTLESKSETVISAPQTSDSTDQTLVTQQRLNRYFHSDVIPKLRKCWQGVQGEGMLETKITFIKARGSWIWQSVVVSSSTLPRGQ